MLRQLYGAAVPDPIQVTVTRWAADPFSRGSYSFFAVGNPKSITAELEAPVGRLLFAGEATSDKPATGVCVAFSWCAAANHLRPPCILATP